MATETSAPGRKFSWFKFILFVLLGGLIILGISIALKFYYSFMDIDGDSYARFAFSWKKDFATESLMKPWSILQPNSWDDKNKKLNDFVELAQGKVGDKFVTEIDDKAVFKDFYPEHFPRFPQWMYYELNYEWNQDTYIPFRKFMVKKSLKEDDKNKKKVDEYINQNIADKDKGASEPSGAAPTVFWDLPKCVLKDYPKYKTDHPKIVETTKALHNLLDHLNSCPEDKKIMKDTDANNNEIVSLTSELFKTMDAKYRYQSGKTQNSDTMTNEKVLLFWKNLGSVSSTPFESFLYTRMFYIFFFHTTSIERKDITDKKTKEKRKQDAKETYVQRHEDFAKLMVQAFKLDTPEPNKFKAFFQPKLAKKDDLKMEDDLKKKYMNLLNVN